jgi:putative ABC transport system permease protein
MWAAFFSDLCSSYRGLRRERGFALAIVLALGAGIGANVALFSIINSLLFRPLPYQNPEELVELRHSRREIPFDALNGAQTLAPTSAAAFQSFNFAVTTASGVTRLFGSRVTPNLFTTLGVSPVIGRPFSSYDKNQKLVMLSHHYWRQAFGDPSIVGQQLLVNGEGHTVAGILPSGFVLQVRDHNLFIADPAMTQGRTIARRCADVTVNQVRGEIESILRALPNEAGSAATQQRPAVTPINQAFLPGSAEGVIFLQGAVGLVLLITCANIANLMLARASRKRKDFAIRAAMGASQARLVRQLLMESTLLATGGGVLGVFLAAFTNERIEKFLPANVGRMLRGSEAISMDWRVVLFALGASVATVLVFGVVPAISALRLDVISHLKASSHTTTPSSQRLGQTLVGAEVGLAVLLLIGAGLLIKSVVRLSRIELGFSAENVLRATFEPTRQRYPQVSDRMNSYRAAAEELSRIPGVAEVGILAPQLFPFGGPLVTGAAFEIQGRTAGEPKAELYTANPQYFRAVRIPLLQGRYFTDNDRAGSPEVALISEVVARKYFGNENPIGKRVRFELWNPNRPWVTIVGIVGDIRNPIGLAVQPTAYRPWEQRTDAATGGQGLFMIRTSGDVAGYIQPVARVLRGMEPNAPQPRIDALAPEVENYISPQRFSASILGIFAVVGLLLAAAGVYGVMRYWVQSRLPEMGIRAALGAQPRAVIQLVVSKAMVAAGVGAASGLGGALALNRVIENQLYGLSSVDPGVFLLVAAVMMLSAFLAAFLPARLAANADPMAALRQN